MLCIHYFLIKQKKLFGRPNIKQSKDRTWRYYIKFPILCYKSYNYYYYAQRRILCFYFCCIRILWIEIGLNSLTIFSSCIHSFRNWRISRTKRSVRLMMILYSNARYFIGGSLEDTLQARRYRRKILVSRKADDSAGAPIIAAKPCAPRTRTLLVPENRPGSEKTLLSETR